MSRLTARYVFLSFIFTFVLHLEGIEGVEIAGSLRYTSWNRRPTVELHREAICLVLYTRRRVLFMGYVSGYLHQAFACIILVIIVGLECKYYTMGTM